MLPGEKRESIKNVVEVADAHDSQVTTTDNRSLTTLSTLTTHHPEHRHHHCHHHHCHHCHHHHHHHHHCHRLRHRLRHRHRQVLAEPGSFDGELVVLCRKAANLRISILPIPKAVADKLRKGIRNNSQHIQPAAVIGGNRAAARSLIRSPGGVMARIRGALEEKRASMDSNPDSGNLSSPPMSPPTNRAAMGGLSATTSPATPAASRKQHSASKPTTPLRASRSSSFLGSATTTGISN